MSYYTYALKSRERNYIYVGITGNPEQRISAHNLGKNKTTRPYGPFEVILLEKYNTRQEAREREKYLKSGIGKEFLKHVEHLPEWRNW
ncbi:MAG: GIY-YIG nuclease family protein [Candidatus Paceibacterota bacterium]